MIPGGWQYDLPRMNGLFPQVNLNAFRVLTMLKSSEQLQRIDPEDNILAQYYLDSTLSSFSNTLKTAFGTAAIAYAGKRHLAPYALSRFLYAFKASVAASYFRLTGKHRTRFLPKIKPVLRWQLYRRYIRYAMKAETELPDDIQELLGNFGFELTPDRRLQLTSKIRYVSGVPDWVYQAQRIDPATCMLCDDTLTPDSYFRIISPQLLP
jgi:hypothetical protein